MDKAREFIALLAMVKAHADHHQDVLSFSALAKQGRRLVR